MNPTHSILHAALEIGLAASPSLSPVLRRLVGRITFGGNRYEWDLAKTLGYDGYLDYHLAYASIPDDALARSLSKLTTLNSSPIDMFMMMEKQGDDRPVVEFITATLSRSAYSKRQLYQRMVEFWSDHFNIFLGKDTQELLKPLDDRNVIRKHALGRFPELLRASARSGAMLMYLDNVSNHVAAPNQNYARELMELYTLGPGHYTQYDIEEVARCFTGWNVDRNEKSKHFGVFRFEPHMHDYGVKNVLGHRIPSGNGVEDGERVLEILTSDPKLAPLTGRFIGQKLVEFFWGEDPPAELVEQVAKVYVQTKGAIKPMVRASLGRPWLERARPKLKRPYHLMMSAIRALPSEIEAPEALADVLRVMGHLPFHWVAPDGYPTEAAYWGGHLLSRWSFGAWFVDQNSIVRIDDALFDGALTPQAFLDRIDASFFGGTLPSRERDALNAYLARDPKDPAIRRETVGLALASPAFQWY